MPSSLHPSYQLSIPLPLIPYIYPSSYSLPSFIPLIPLLFPHPSRPISQSSFFLTHFSSLIPLHSSLFNHPLFNLPSNTLTLLLIYSTTLSHLLLTPLSFSSYHSSFLLHSPLSALSSLSSLTPLSSLSSLTPFITHHTLLSSLTTLLPLIPLISHPFHHSSLTPFITHHSLLPSLINLHPPLHPSHHFLPSLRLPTLYSKYSSLLITLTPQIPLINYHPLNNSIPLHPKLIL
jgi:hypothetical protein